ncbi:uncharacterized protein [Clytia hemisphaerica]|uniref:uncharacterized protein n=1 Tax=Clytia hemisphaerica TaxID=252671 RepID=UPI0034D576EB
MKVFTLCYGAAEVKLRISQVIPQNIGRSFQIADTSGIFLKFGSSAEFINNEGVFELGDYPDKTTFTVCISGISGNQASHPQPSTSSSPATSQASTPIRQSSPVSVSRITRKVLASVRVVKADVGENGKPANVHFHNTIVHVKLYSEDQANVRYILEVVNNEVSDVEDLVLVGPDGIKIPDQEGTRGITFWKVGSRKVFAVDREEMDRHRSLEFDSSPAVTVRKRRRTNNSSSEDRDSTNSLLSELSEVKRLLKSYKSLAFKHKFPVSYLKALEEAFTCCICQRFPARQPMGCQQCGTLVSCQSCSDRHYAGSNSLSSKSCPKCRCPRGVAQSFRLRGFDDLIDQVLIMENLSDTEDADNENDDGFDDTLPVVVPE